MKKALAFLLLLSLVLTGCQSAPAPAADPLAGDTRYSLTAYDLGSGLTPSGQACLSGGSLYFTASAAQASETRLCRAELASGKLTTLSVYPATPEGTEAYTSVAALLPAEDGLWVMENTTHYIFDLPKNFDENLESKWEYYQYRGDSTVLRQLDDAGQEQTAFTLTNLQSSLQTAAAAGDYLFCAQAEHVLVLTKDGSTVTTVDIPGWVSALIAADDTLWVLTDHEKTGAEAYALHPQDFTLTPAGTLPVSVYAVSGTQNDALFFPERGNLFSWDLKAAAGRKLLDWQDYGINRSGITSLQMTSDGLCALYQPSPGETLQLLVLKNANDAAPEYDLTLGVLYPDENTMNLVLDFNSKNNGGKLRVRDYSEYEVLGRDAAAQLRIDLAAGEGPDLLFSADWNQPVTALAETMLTDLSPYLEKDEGLISQGLLYSVFDALRDADGSLYTVASSFLFSTAIGREDIVSPAPITVSRFNLLCQSMEPEPYTTRQAAMEGHLQRRHSTYFGAGRCDLEKDAFTQGLNFVRLYPQTLDWGSTEEEWSRVRQGNQVYLSGSYLSFQSLAEAMSSVGENAVLCGWPDTPGGHALQIWESWGMLQSCRDKALGWRFLRQILTEDYQTSTQLTGLPTNLAAFRRLGQAATQGGEVSFRPMGQEMVEISTRLTQKQYDAIESAVMSTVTVSRPVPEALTQAVLNAAADYFAGSESADDAARSAQFAAQAVLEHQG